MPDSVLTPAPPKKTMFLLSAMMASSALSIEPPLSKWCDVWYGKSIAYFSRKGSGLFGSLALEQPPGAGLSDPGGGQPHQPAVLRRHPGRGYLPHPAAGPGPAAAGRILCRGPAPPLTCPWPPGAPLFSRRCGPPLLAIPYGENPDLSADCGSGGPAQSLPGSGRAPATATPLGSSSPATGWWGPRAASPAMPGGLDRKAALLAWNGKRPDNQKQRVENDTLFVF